MVWGTAGLPQRPAQERCRQALSRPSPVAGGFGPALTRLAPAAAYPKVGQAPGPRSQEEGSKGGREGARRQGFGDFKSLFSHDEAAKQWMGGDSKA